MVQAARLVHAVKKNSSGGSGNNNDGAMVRVV
jgi:hypothetical protein